MEPAGRPTYGRGMARTVRAARTPWRIEGPVPRRWLAALPAVVIAAAPIVGVAPAVPAAAGTAGPSVPAPGQSSILFGVTCPSSSDCWAVGRYRDVNGAGLNQILHWNGSAWSLVFAPEPGGTTAVAFNSLYGVACASASDCWAVGAYFNASGVQFNQALRWNGTRWSLVSTPQPGIVRSLAGVRCTSGSSCWAVGAYRNTSNATLNQALRWNGTKWSLVSTPQPGGTATSGNFSELNGIGCTSASNCWAGGDYRTASITTAPDLNQALRWNGTTWSLVSTPQPAGTAAGDTNELGGVSCTSSSDCWAVGVDANLGSRTFLNQALHWDGSTWALVTTPDPDGTGGGATNGLNAVTCTSASNCWAVGSYGQISGGSGVVVNQALRWDGSTWSLVTTPDPGGLNNTDGNVLYAVRCAGTTSCLAVGYVSVGGGSAQNQALFWNGSTWSSG